MLHMDTHQNYEEIEENLNTRRNQGIYTIIFQQTSEVQIMTENKWKIIFYLIPLTANKILFHLKILKDCNFYKDPFDTNSFSSNSCFLDGGEGLFSAGFSTDTA